MTWRPNGGGPRFPDCMTDLPVIRLEDRRPKPAPEESKVPGFLGILLFLIVFAWWFNWITERDDFHFTVAECADQKAPEGAPQEVWRAAWDYCWALEEARR